MNYPCKGCIVMYVCSSGCSKLIFNLEEITRRIRKYKCCPDCGSKGTMSSNKNEAPEYMMVSCDTCHSRLWINTTLKFIERSLIRKGPFTWNGSKIYARDTIAIPIHDIVDFIKEDNDEAML